ncbi:glycosyltransferase family 2 protein [Paenibacillus aceris]|uniref:Glycosyltransferase involved in cell wall biosynthesis n=1 Tax=Paenibacillus aceris TaxID=869555 RepID=A0ABS4HT16_9BACL|nr:glycosyltransferase family 2 protein [Paenibacillus aceris]MBP1961783.1 glycosyltransferase involved in cell wall biosynthesis [Paenibacillus aceris]NHW34360.1 glycosyltransferase family 2 protein [Paenibacillus aceris]
MRILIIVPAFNEEQNIVKTINSIKNAGNFDILVINDRSIDQTLLLAKTQKNIKIIDLACNLGIGGAVQTGYKYAEQHNYDIAIQIDGDGQHDPNFIEKVVTPITQDGYDIVIGSRFINYEGFQSTKMRRVGILYIQHLIRMISGMQITDPTSGFRAFGKRAISYFAKHYPNDYPEPESIVIAHRLGMKIKEVPVVMRARESGSSSIYSYKSVYYMLKVTLSIMVARLTRVMRDA